MVESKHPAQDQGNGDPQFHAILTPYRSLPHRGFVSLMIAVAAVSFIAGMFFVMNGAWPVMGFFGLDVLLIYWAFKLNYRAGRAFETVDLTPENLVITRISSAGKKERIEFNPYWSRVRINEKGDGRTEMELYHHKQRLVFGGFLTDDERREFAETLARALLEMRGGVRI